MDERQLEAAKRILELIPFWERNNDLTEAEQINEIYNEISLDPISTINYLLDIIDNYTT